MMGKFMSTWLGYSSTYIFGQIQFCVSVEGAFG